jgi:hypothetical protein
LSLTCGLTISSTQAMSITSALVSIWQRRGSSEITTAGITASLLS